MATAPSSRPADSLLDTLPGDWVSLVTPSPRASGCWLVHPARDQVQRELTWYRGSVPLAEPVANGDLVTCMIEWRPLGEQLIRIRSAPARSFENALAEVIESARPHGADEELDWSGLVTLRTGSHLQVRFENLTPEGPTPNFICTLSHSRKRTLGVSGAFPTRMEAFENVIRVVERSRRSSGLKAAHAGSVMDARIWKFEHSWLLSLTSRTKEQDARLLRLSQFLAFTDPLRKYELDPRDLRELQLQAAGELSQHAFWSTELGRKNWVAMLLAALFGPSAESGAEVAASLDFEAAAARCGLPASAALLFLQGELVLKRAREDSWILTSLGSKVLAEAGSPDKLLRKALGGIPDDTIRGFAHLEQALENTSTHAWFSPSNRRMRRGPRQS